MKSNRSWKILFCLTGLVLLFILGWGGAVFYAWQYQRVNDRVDHFIQRTAVKLQEENMTVNNFAKSLSDSEQREKIAFAIGMTGNTGKMSLWFDENQEMSENQARRQDAAARKKGSKDTIIHLSNDFVKQLKVSYVPEAVKSIRDFRDRFKKKIDSSGIGLRYDIVELTPATRLFDTKRASASPGFIINYYDPKIYRLYYDISPSTIWVETLPYIVVSLILIILFAASCVLLFRSWRSAQQAARFREALFSNITHELKTPLSSMQLILGLIDNKETTVEAGTHLPAAKKELARMQLLVDKIISFGRMSQEDFELNNTIVDLNEVVTAAIDTAAPVTGRSGASLRFTAYPGRISVAADHTLLVNAIVTMIENAVKYGRDTPHIDIRLDVLPAGESRIAISDNGIGIDKVYYHKIFEPFFRIPAGNVHTVKGDGLGLSYAMQVVRLHGGDIIVTSVPGEGSLFTITIPI